MYRPLRMFAAAAAVSLAAYGYAADPTYVPADGYPDFALGADVSWTSYIEANSTYTYYKGTTIATDQITDVPSMLSDYGIDAVRLRVWVNPESTLAKSGFTCTVDGTSHETMGTYGTCTADQTVALAKRLSMQGHRLMVVFQMSDTWADPGAQYIPADWSSCTTTAELAQKAAAHVTEVLQALHDANVNVAWVQIGNETNTGMLRCPMPTATGQTVSNVDWGCTIASSGTDNSNFVTVFSQCATAARKVYPEVKTVLHLANGDYWNSVTWTLSKLKNAGFNATMCDYIGLSLYPGLRDGKESYTGLWQTYADLTITTINNIYSTYGYRSLLCEIGMNNEYSLSANTTGVASADLQATYIAQCNTDVRAFNDYLIANLATDGSKCDGLFYWEPETDYICGYTRGACVSATPGASWPRTKVTANDWWKSVQDHSTFPAGGLVEFRLNDNTDPDDPDDPSSGFVPDPDLKLYLYYYTDTDVFVPLTTTDGLVYYLTDFSAAQWFNFKVATTDWSILLGNAEIGLNVTGVLNNSNDWFAWTKDAVADTYYWWYRHDTHAMTITSDAVCPWTDITSLFNIQVSEPDAPIQWYDLSGRLVTNPGRGVYIMRQGSTIRKVVF